MRASGGRRYRGFGNPAKSQRNDKARMLRRASGAGVE